MMESTFYTVPVQALCGMSPPIQRINEMINQVAHTDVAVLIIGESGTGKEMAARSIHQTSNRNNYPFVAIHCASKPIDLLELELFGYEKEAFPQASCSSEGLIAQANQGTLFLYQIEALPLDTQVKILRVIQEKRYERIGGKQSMAVDVRIIAATNKNLENEIKKETFREDLYYILNVFPIQMPSLKERKMDIPMIISTIVNWFEKERNVSIQLCKNALHSLQNCDWNGNIKELSSLIERLILLFPNKEIDVEHLPEKYQRNASALMTETVMINTHKMNSQHNINLKDMLNHIEVTYIKEALDKTNGIVSHAAEKLGMRRTTLIEKMKKLNISK